MTSQTKLNEAIRLYNTSPSYIAIKDMLNYYMNLNEINQVIDDACFGRSLDKNGLQIYSDHYWNTFQVYKTNDNNELQWTDGRGKANWLDWTYNIRKDILEHANYFLERANDFNDIYDRIFRITTKHAEFAELYAYDVSLRIGSKLGKMPKDVYLHAGAKEGFKRIFGKEGEPVVEVSTFYKKSEKFEGLSAYQIENFLCVAKVNSWL